jgi:hypothetical protein
MEDMEAKLKEVLLEARTRKITGTTDGRLVFTIPRQSIEHTKLRRGMHYRAWITADGGLRIEPVKGG